MVLVDTSVWVAHFRKKDRQLTQLLEDGLVCCHPYIIGELACGFLHNRDEILSLLQTLTQVTWVDHDETLTFIKNKSLFGKGVGYIDVHLLASAILSQTKLWTLDKKLKELALQLKINH